ncbi:MAG: hypothetical protein ABMA64_14575 [Myxococcota bacterium]
MQRIILWGCIAGFAACLNKPTLVSVTPDYGYVDGCVDVVIQGHHLGTEGTAKIGDAEFLSLAPAEENPDLPEQAQDVGFLYSGRVPPSPTGQAGWFDVVLTVDGESLTIPEGWYYRSCPAPINVDGYTLPGDGYGAVASGDSINFVGCNLTDQVTVRFMQHDDGVARLAGVTTGTTTGGTTGTTDTSVTTPGTTDTSVTTPGTTDTSVTTPGTTDTGTTPGTTDTSDTGGGTTPPITGTTVDSCGAYGLTEVATATLVSDCSSAQTHVVVPQLPTGTYDVWLALPDGTTWTGGVYPHTADTGITCEPLTITVGGAK